jgi:hypothetical protein
MKNAVFFQPWIGSKYWNESTQVLVLGESHHGENPSPDWTVEVVREYIANESSESWFPTFTKLGQAITGSPAWELDREGFWSSVAFYNYVQVALPESRMAPTKDMFDRAVEPFKETISNLKPTHIIALGFRLWENMPPFVKEHPDIKCGEIASDCGYYSNIDGSHLSLSIRIKHPSVGFSPKQWHPLVSKFLKIRLDQSST